jgi:hypothetical protein
LFSADFPDEVEDVAAMAYDKRKKKRNGSSQEDAPKKLKQKRWLKMSYCRGSRRGHSHPRC